MEATTWRTFVKQHHHCFEEREEQGLFLLVDALDEVYRIAGERLPFLNRDGDKSSFLDTESERAASDLFQKCFFVCHRSLMSAAMAIASGLPEDGEPITRRALEVASTCLAVKSHPPNFKKWLSAECRLARWKQRRDGTKPKPFQPQYDKVMEEPLYQELKSKFGELSDLAGHFTPEFFSRFEWQKELRDDGGANLSFSLPLGMVELAFLMVSEHHELIFRVFDHCYGGKMLQCSKVKVALQKVYSLHDDFRQQLSTALSN